MSLQSLWKKHTQTTPFSSILGEKYEEIWASFSFSPIKIYKISLWSSFFQDKCTFLQMDLDPLKIDITQHKLIAFCVHDCNPSLNHDQKCNGACFKICPHLCKTFSLHQDFLPPIPRIPPLILHPPVTETSTITQTNMIAIIMIILACILFFSILVCIFCIFLRFHHLRQTRERRERIERISPVFFGTQEDFHDEDQWPGINHYIWYRNTIGLQQSAIDLIAVFKYKKDELVTEGTECSVCLNEFQEDDSLKLLPKCSHAFHIPCIDTWLRSHKNCPLCRAPIVSDDFDARIGFQMENSNLGNGEEDTSEVRNEDEPNCSLALEAQHALRSSVSLDSSSAMAIHNAFDAESECQMLQNEDLTSKNVCRRPRNGGLSFREVMKSSSMRNMLQKGSSSSSTAKSGSSSSLSHDSSSILPL